MDRVGFEPTTSAMPVELSIFDGDYKKENFGLKSHPLHLFSLSPLMIAHIPSSEILRMDLTIGLQQIHSYRSDISSSHIEIKQ
jgi:hypothetical protein